jgi:hypothetical protein
MYIVRCILRWIILEDIINCRQIESTCCDVGTEQDTLCILAERLVCLRALLLCQGAMQLHECRVHQCVLLRVRTTARAIVGPVRELEERMVEFDTRACREEHDGFEVRAAARRRGPASRRTACQQTAHVRPRAQRARMSHTMLSHPSSLAAPPSLTSSPPLLLSFSTDSRVPRSYADVLLGGTVESSRPAWMYREYGGSH